MSADAFLGGRITILQPDQGFRAGLDSVMLAAFVTAQPGEQVLELGSGVGTAALCLAHRVPEVRVLGLEIQDDMMELAVRNAAANGLANQAEFRLADVEAPPADLPRDHFDHAMMNPPFFVEGPHDPSPHPGRRRAASGDAELLDRWVKTARTALHAKGRLSAVLPAERLPAMLQALETGFGAVTIVPLWPRAGEAAKRVLVGATKGSRAPLRLMAGVVLHEADGRPTEAAERILRGGEGFQP